MKAITFQVIDNAGAIRVALQIAAMNIVKPTRITVELDAKKRSNRQNSTHWVGLLADISNQGVINGKQFSVKIWHEYLKERFLPEQFAEGKTMKNYIKWQEMPDGKMRMVGSTTQLTRSGFSDYMAECEAWAVSELGVRLSARPF